MMNWNQLISAKRFGMEEFHEERQENRSEFQRDYDRLIFSAPFRRLQNKTQVFPLPGSVFCTQPTYAQSRSRQRWPFTRGRCCQSTSGTSSGTSRILSCRRLVLSSRPLAWHTIWGIRPSVIQVKRLFLLFFSEGKGVRLKEKQPNGEQLSPMEWEDLTHFEGNANAFRILTHQFEGRRKGGFVLTYTTLASIVKYPFSSSLAGTKSKFGFFISEEESFQKNSN